MGFMMGAFVGCGAGVLFGGFSSLRFVCCLLIVTYDSLNPLTTRTQSRTERNGTGGSNGKGHGAGRWYIRDVHVNRQYDPLLD
jgi:hypothetical protein